MKRGGDKHASLIVHIGSASVGAALVREHARDAAELSEVIRAPYTGGSDAAMLEAAMKDALGKLLDSYAPHASSIGHIHAILSAPWHHARIRTVSAESKKNGPITLRSVEKMVQTYKDEAPPAVGRVDLEAAAFQIAVNGYGTTLAHPVDGATVKVNLYESEIDESAGRAITGALVKALPHVKTSYHSFPLVAAGALRTLSSDTPFSLVDIGGGVTEFVVVNQGIQYLATFPQGTGTVLSALEKTGTKDTRSRLSLLTRGELAPGDAEAVEKGVSDAFAPWLTAFGEAAKAASDIVPMPRTLYVLSEGEDLPWIMKRFTDATMAAIPADASLFQSVIAVGEHGAYDPALSTAALFFHMNAERRMVYSDK